MIISTACFMLSLVLYLSLTAGSGNILLWSLEELVFGVVFSFITALLAERLFSLTGIKLGRGFFNPRSWVLFLAYITGPFLFNVAKANIILAWRVITGKIKPGIVRINPGLNQSGTAMLANSITLTPGTLSVDVDEKNNIYVHCIYIKHREPEITEVCSGFHKWIRRITG